ncbi:2OG-Fe(II) oxygenase [Sphingomonas sp.]|uniref:2OG-Fe(II) oxygenase n=1 Tax=Sphingomonas sp. TaxID=28214 RepID=UPI0035C7906E
MSAAALRQELEATARRGGLPAAVELLRTRAEAGELPALEMLAHWHLWGSYVPRDPAAGYAVLTRAAELGSTEAALTRAALLATGTGVAVNVAAAAEVVRTVADRSPLAARQLALLDTQPVPPAARVVQADPHVAVIDGLLSADECRYLIDTVGPRVQPSMVVDPATRRRIPNPVRDSHGTNVSPVDEDMVVNAINRRVAAATGTDWAQGEPLHLLRYAVGQQYKPHFDALPGVDNQRSITVLLYLNDDFAGGETWFKNGLTLRGRAGDAIVFRNLTDDGHVDRRTEHAGLPVTAGVKWLATRWIRQRSFDPWSGQGG